MEADQPRDAAEEAESPFSIRAASSRIDVGSRILKADETFVVLDRSGDISPGGANELGLYHAGTRFLSRFALHLEGGRPFLLSSEVHEDNAAFVANLTNPDLLRNGASLTRGSVHLVRECRLGPSTLDVRVRLRSYAAEPLRLRLTLEIESDFADIFEVRGTPRPARGRLFPPRWRNGVVPAHLWGARWDRPPSARGCDAGGDSRFRRQARVRRRALGGGRADAELAGGLSRREIRDRPHGRPERGPPRFAAGARLQREVRCLAPPVRRGSPDDDDAHRLGHLPLRRRALVQRSLRPRRHPDRPRAAVAGSGSGPRRPALSGGAPGPRGRSVPGRRARQDSSRGSPRRDGQPRRGALRPVLRERRRHTALRHPRRSPLRSDGRSRVRPGDVAARREGARVDESMGRSRWGRLPRVFRSVPAGPRPSGLEGLA